MIKPLLVITQPRMVKEFLESQKNIKIDKLWLKFYPSDIAYNTARAFFLNSDYTHFMILPDDLIVTQDDINTIANYDEKFDSISGWCNNTIKETLYIDTNISISPLSPPDPPRQSTYDGYHFMSIEEIKRMAKEMEQPIAVTHQGFALTRLSKKLIEKVPFRHDFACCADSCLSIDLRKVGIKQYVDCRIETRHIKVPWTEILVGKEKPIMYYEKSVVG